MISLSAPVLGEQEKEALCHVLESGWLTMGENVEAFESTFANLHNAADGVAVSSCTSGLHLSLAALGVGPGDEVLVPSLTFVATVNAVLYVGATPVFVDIESEVLPHISISDAMSKCTSRTKAVIIMHFAGYLVDLAAWRAFADEEGIFLIEDAAHAPGVTGSNGHSDVAVYSFFSNKNMTTAEGGMVLARDISVLGRIRRLRSHGMTAATLDRERGHGHSYDVTDLGYNYRMDELRAAVGLVQLRSIERWNTRRRELSTYYRNELAKRLPDVIVPFDSDYNTAAHLFPTLLPEAVQRARTMKILLKAGIQSSIHYPPVHRFSYYCGRFPNVSLPETDSFCSRELSLPLHPSLEKSDVDRVVAVLKSAI